MLDKVREIIGEYIYSDSDEELHEVVAKMLLEKNASITICHSKSKEIEEYAAFADLVVVAVGKEGVFDARLAPKASMLVDVGINFNE